MAVLVVFLASKDTVSPISLTARISSIGVGSAKLLAFLAWKSESPAAELHGVNQIKMAKAVSVIDSFVGYSPYSSKSWLLVGMVDNIVNSRPN